MKDFLWRLLCELVKNSGASLNIKHTAAEVPTEYFFFFQTSDVTKYDIHTQRLQNHCCLAQVSGGQSGPANKSGNENLVREMNHVLYGSGCLLLSFLATLPGFFLLDFQVEMGHKVDIAIGKEVGSTEESCLHWLRSSFSSDFLNDPFL